MLLRRLFLFLLLYRLHLYFIHLFVDAVGFQYWYRLRFDILLSWNSPIFAGTVLTHPLNEQFSCQFFKVRNICSESSVSSSYIFVDQLSNPVFNCLWILTILLQFFDAIFSFEAWLWFEQNHESINSQLIGIVAIGVVILFTASFDLGRYQVSVSINPFFRNIFSPFHCEGIAKINHSCWYDWMKHVPLFLADIECYIFTVDVSMTEVDFLNRSDVSG